MKVLYFAALALPDLEHSVRFRLFCDSHLIQFCREYTRVKSVAAACGWFCYDTSSAGGSPYKQQGADIGVDFSVQAADGG